MFTHVYHRAFSVLVSCEWAVIRDLTQNPLVIIYTHKAFVKFIIVRQRLNGLLIFKHLKNAWFSGINRQVIGQ